MAELLSLTSRLLQEKRMPPLIVIGMFTVLFLKIHPFADGNERLSRGLTLLLQTGYTFVQYAPLDRVIEKSLRSYYTSLWLTQRTLRNKTPDRNAWLSYFLGALRRQIRAPKTCAAGIAYVRQLPDISVQVLEALRAHGTLSITELEALLGVNRFTMRDHFKRLTRDGFLLRVGRGRITKYILKNPD